MTSFLSLQNISFAYPSSEPLFSRLNLNLYREGKIFIRGRNGAGKTTLFSLIMGLLKPTEGSILLEGNPIKTKKDIRHLRQKVGLLFQDPDDQLFCPTLLDDILFGPLNLGMEKEEAMDSAMKAMKVLNIVSLASYPPYALSGGQKRLGALAALLSMKPELLLLDEPSNGLDEEAWENLVSVLQKLPIALVIASHDIPFLEQVTHKGYEMKKGYLLSLN